MEDNIDLIYSTECLGAFSTEKALTTAQRKKLPTKIYGITRDKKFPLEDAAHVKSAMARFNSCPEKDRPVLAKKIKIAANKYNVKYSKNDNWYKYCNK
jgi:hypothetical protein